MIKKCQVCDGPIVNGRCKYCGMPYRNDEVLYHLNESRTDHYRHATEDAKKIMRQQAMPAQDKKAALGRTSSKEEIKAHQQKVRQAAVERMTASQPKTARNPGSTQGQMRNSRNNRSQERFDGQPQIKRVSGKRESSRRNSKFSLFVVVVLALAGIIPGVAEEITTRYGTKENEAVEEVWTSPDIEETEALEWAEKNGKIEYHLKPENGEVLAGEMLEAGSYEAYVESGSAEVLIVGSYEERGYGIHEDGGSIVLLLREGETIRVSEGASADYVVLSLLSNTMQNP